MTTKQQNFADMAQTTYNKLQPYKASWENIPEFVSLENELKETLNGLTTFDKEAKIITTGSTSDKSGAKDQAIAAVVKISGPAMVYALNNSNLTLHDQLNVSKTKLRKMQDGTLPQRLNGIIEEIEKIAEPLAGYGVKPEDIADAKTKTETYTAQVNTPRGLITKRSTKIETVADYIDLLRDILYRLDKMMRLFAGTEFHRDYKNARKIVDLGSRTASPSQTTN
ncbi:MAG: hypothetical protein PHO94_02790 [Petrimonas sp.]|nr:hypothetical protein [Petrimonas sp.]